ncbi:hypothetical protein BJ138DRAFT_1116335 [Hygrophoropsis aurantiaca]|uniref:Uncharacterized protein n=1 Tax=Hygrophoropsis aurantiaca TaxID=72124 RepID=A0ACB8A4Z8_9AGAM|nr:hypothetical protein BJ138DRAFT_1116335 [Hygrophoropsis aurantiaca]
MDEYYNYAAARLDLESHTLKRNLDPNKRYYQLCIWDGAMADTCTAFKLPGDRRTICTTPNQQTKEQEEAMFTLQGVISDLDLPPLKFQPKAQQMRHIRQSVTLTGLGHQVFEQAVTTLYGINTLLERLEPPGTVEKWKPSDYAGFTAINLQNRYFTPKRFANGLPSIPFDDMNDSNRYLRSCNNPDFVHTEENNVEFYASAKAGAEKIAPSAFRVGDIVEACVSAVMAPINAEQCRMIVVLRSLALLESRHTMSSNTSREIARGTIAFRTATSKLPKRRRAYAQEEENSNDNTARPSASEKRPKAGNDVGSVTGQNESADKHMAVE